MYRDSFYILKVLLVNWAKSVFTTHSPFTITCSAEIINDCAWECVVKTPSIIRLQGDWANFSSLQLAPKVIIVTFESGKDLTVSCSSIWSEQTGVKYFAFVTRFKPKKTREFVPLPFGRPFSLHTDLPVWSRLYEVTPIYLYEVRNTHPVHRPHWRGGWMKTPAPLSRNVQGNLAHERLPTPLGLP